MRRLKLRQNINSCSVSEMDGPVFRHSSEENYYSVYTSKWTLFQRKVLYIYTYFFSMRVLTTNRKCGLFHFFFIMCSFENLPLNLGKGNESQLHVQPLLFDCFHGQTPLFLRKTKNYGAHKDRDESNIQWVQAR